VPCPGICPGYIALINSIGNLAGFVGPYAVGWVRESTGSFSLALLALAALPLGAGVLMLVLGHNPALEGHGAAPRAAE